MKEIEINYGKLNVWLHTSGMSVTVEALETLKRIGQAYGIYSMAGERSRHRLSIEEEPEWALVLQEDTSYHGSPNWETERVITTDPRRIEAYSKFRELLTTIEELEREEEITARTSKNNLKKEGNRSNER